MAYSDFNFDKLETDLQLTIVEADLYSSTAPLEINPVLEEILRELRIVVQR